MTIDLTYRNLQQLVAPYLGGTRTESRAFLSWFLEHIYRLDPTQAEDCVCDGPDDKGVDGIYVDKEATRIDIFQCKIAQTERKTLGDTTLKDLVGTLAQFDTQGTTESLQQSTRNTELRHRLEDDNVADLIGQGWTVRGVMVSNSAMDDSAKDYLALQDNTRLVVNDRDAINTLYVSPEHVAPRSGPTTFHTFGYDVSEFKVLDAKVVIAPLSGTELVTLEGIDSGELFDYNVRQSLGRTAVNRDIEKSVRDPNEHRHFMLYHNGLTIIADQVDTSVRDQIVLTNYLVVNGCQSLTALWDNRNYVTDDLRVLGRLIELSPGSPLLNKITHNSNNQNGIKPRDFQSNNPIQLRLRTEFTQKYGGLVGYRISRGEEVHASEAIDNEEAARVLLAFDLEQPWACHQTYRLFDELHSAIFARPVVNATHIVSRMDAFTAVNDVIASLDHELVRKYTLTKYFLLYVLSEALKTDPKGAELLSNPESIVGDPATSEKRSNLRAAFQGVLQDLLADLDSEISDREQEEYFDHKRVLKSPTEVKTLARSVLTSYRKFVRRGAAEPFSVTLAQAAVTPTEPNRV